MKKILIIGYGGTIVMVIDKKRNAVVPAENIQEILALVPNLKEVADVTFEILANIDSTNVTPLDWTKLAMFIARHHDAYDGFVITHGTNTMAYTASALALALGRGVKKPVVITGSQLPLTVYGNDARFNFENAVKTAAIAAAEQVNEVMVVFNDLILRGARTVKVSESDFRAFDSPAFPPLGHIRSTGIHFDHSLTLHADHSIPFQPKTDFETGVLTIDLVPGQLPSLIEGILHSKKCTGLLLKSHGAGSVPTVGEYSFLPFIEKATATYQIPVLVTTKFLGGNAMKKVNDEPAIQAIEAGAISSRDMTDVMSEVKLMWLLAQGYRTTGELRLRIENEYIGEVT